MLANIACSFPNCTQPVIGQCTGYKEECRRYYCATHSNNNLCYHCAEKKRAEETAELTKQEYLKTIKEIKQNARTIVWKIFLGNAVAKWGVGITLFLILLGFIVNENNNNLGTAFFYLGGFGVLVGLVLLLTSIDEQERILVKSIDQQKDGFSNFFNEWKKEQQKKTWKVIGTVVGIIFVILIAAIAGAVGESSEKRKN